MRICIIGASGHYGYVLNSLDDGCPDVIVGIAPGPGGEDIAHLFKDVNSTSRPAPRTYDCYLQMLDHEKPDMAVVNCIFGMQGKVVAEVLRRGIHVFAEKPLAADLQELADIQRLAQSPGIHLAAMMALRYERPFYTAYRLIHQGAVGELRLLQAQKSYKLGKRPSFYKDRQTYGGTIPWVGSHGVDWIHWFTGQKFVSVYASHSSKGNQGHGSLEAAALCHFELEDSIFASVSIDYLRPDGASGHGDDRIRAVGTDGILEVIESKVYLTSRVQPCREMDLEEVPGTMFSDFAAQVQGSEKCLISKEDSLYVTKICLLTRQSADEGRVIATSHGYHL